MINFEIKTQRGFTLIELMIGLALGLIASLAIFTTILSFETQRKTTASGADMQQNGLMALYQIEQDARQAGFGLIDTTSIPHKIHCTQLQPNNLSIAPVTLTDGGTGPDTITIHRLDSTMGGLVTGSQASMLLSPISASPSLANTIVDTIKAIHLNDYLLIPGLNAGVNYDCYLILATTLPAVAPQPQPAANASLIDLGPGSPAFSQLTYSINNANFNQYDLMQSSSVLNANSMSWGTPTENAIANNIVNIQAQYGVADPGSPSSPLCWTDATGSSACPVTVTGTTSLTGGADWSNPPAADIKRIQAIRVAIVARSAQKVGASGSCNTTTAAPISWVDSTGASTPPVIDLTAIPDWGCYRYKVYQTIIPIRNVIWGNL